MDARCRIELLGELRVLQGERTLTRFRTQKAALLLSYLAVHLGQSCSREALIDLFWPEMDLEEGRNNLNTTVTSLRRQLEPSGIPAGSVLITSRLSVRLNPAAVSTDLLEFEQHLRAAASAGSPAERARFLGQAAYLYRGEMLAGCYDEWALLEQARWSARHADALEQWAAAQEQNGELEAALETARRAVRADPYREAAYRRQMRLCAMLGRGPAALAIYQELERFLTAELGLSPAAETRELAAQIRRDPEALLAPQASGNAAVSADRGPGIPGGRSGGAADEGPAEPVSLKRPPLGHTHTSGREPSLPLQLTRFFGRASELARLRELLQPVGPPAPIAQRAPGGGVPGAAGAAPAVLAEPASARVPGHSVRLITLTAPGGSGKTRLAIEAAQEAAPAFDGRVWFVDLAGLPDPNLIPFAVSNALQLPPLSGGDPLQPVVDALGDAPCLLLLDNFEHLLRDPGAGAKNGHPAGSGGGAAFVRLLLERVPRLTCLITSRRPLHLGGEQEFPLPPLEVPEKCDSPERLLECGSVALYVDRAQAAKPDFALTAQNAAAVAGLCRKLEGMPLAVEMAAAWARMLPPARMLERLEHQLELLVSRRRDLPPRQQSLRAAIQWSYDLLAPELQTWFARLGIFRGGWTLEAAEAVCSGVQAFRDSGVQAGCPLGERSGVQDRQEAPDLDAAGPERPNAHPSQNVPGTRPERLNAMEGDALLLLSELQEHSLIVAEEEPRYRMLEPLREFALEKLPPDDHAALGRRHAEFFLGLLQQELAHAEVCIADEPAALKRLEREHDNLRAALAWSQSSGPASLDLALALGGALGLFWSLRGYLKEAREQLERLLALDRQAGLAEGPGASDPGDGRRLARSRLLARAGLIAGDQGDYAAMRAYYEESLSIRRQLGGAKEIAYSLMYLGSAAREEGDMEAARSFFEEALAIERQQGAPGDPGCALALGNMGGVAFCRGDLERARRLYEASRALYQKLGDKRGIAWVLHGLAMIARRVGDGVEGRALEEQSLTLRCELSSPQGIAECLLGFAALAQAQGQSERSARLLGAAASRCEAIGYRLPAHERLASDQAASAARTALGEERFGTVWSEGRAMAPEQAVADALERREP